MKMSARAWYLPTLFLPLPIDMQREATTLVRLDLVYLMLVTLVPSTRPFHHHVNITKT